MNKKGLEVDYFFKVEVMHYCKNYYAGTWAISVRGGFQTVY